MARREVTKVTDDIDGSDLSSDHRPTRFALDGKEYEIDLGEGNRAKLDDLLAPYISSARRVTTRRRRGNAVPQDKERNRKIRQWARANGHTPSDRGRIAQDIIDAYEKANPGE